MNDRNNKYVKLISNAVYFFVCTVLVKLVAYILLPICTQHMSTQEYGEADLIISTINFIYPLVALGIGGSVLRYGMDSSYDKKILLTVSQKLMLFNCAVVFLVIPFSNFFGAYSKYIYLIPIMVLLTNETNLLCDFSKSMDNTKVVVYGSGISAFFKVILVLLFVKYFKLGSIGMLWGYMLASGINVLVLLWMTKAPSYYTKNIPQNICKKYKRDILKYGIPLVPNSLAWWVLQLSDRYMVAYFVGAAANGLYAIAYKIPSILYAIVGIFNQAWQLSVIQEVDSKESTAYYNRIYRYYCLVCYGGTAVVILCTKILAQIMFKNEFYEAWIYVPVLMLAAAIKCQEEFFGPFFLAAKETKSYFVSSVLAAVVNVILNVIMIPQWGVWGASISTLICYYITYVYRALYVKRVYNMKINVLQGILSQFLLCVQVLIWMIVDIDVYAYVIQVVVLAIFIVVYRKEAFEVLGMINNLIKGKMKRKENNAD